MLGLIPRMQRKWFTKRPVPGSNSSREDWSEQLNYQACRAVGIPARYVSGYLYNPKAGPSDGADQTASHAWVDVFVNRSAWLSLDPTHDCLQTMNYVRVAVGRDYADVPPTRGVYKGQAKETLSVNVAVTAL